MSAATRTDIDHLNSFLRGERSALETYSQVMERADGIVVTTALAQGRDSHAQRVRQLEEKIESLGGQPAMDSGVWGAFAKTVQAGAKLFGVSAAVAVLEEGEDHGLKSYTEGLQELSPACQSFVLNSLFPEQRKTHEMLASLQQHA